MQAETKYFPPKPSDPNHSLQNQSTSNTNNIHNNNNNGGFIPSTNGRRRRHRVASTRSDISRQSSLLDFPQSTFNTRLSDVHSQTGSLVAESIERERSPSAMSYRSKENTNNNDKDNNSLNTSTTNKQSPQPIILDKAITWLMSLGSSKLLVYGIIIAFLSTLKISVSNTNFEQPDCLNDYSQQHWWVSFTHRVPMRDWYYAPLDQDSPRCSVYSHPPPLSMIYNYILGFFRTIVQDIPYVPTLEEVNKIRTLESSSSSSSSSSSGIRMIIESSLFREAISWWSVVFYWAKTVQGRHGPNSQFITALVLLLQPALTIIDNSLYYSKHVTLSFVLLTLTNFQNGDDTFACICMALATLCDQMAFYYLPTLWAYVLGKTLWCGSRARFPLVIQSAMCCLTLTFFIVTPFLRLSENALVDLQRIMGFNKGDPQEASNSIAFQGFRSVLASLLSEKDTKIVTAATTVWTVFLIFFSCSLFLWHPTVFKTSFASSSSRSSGKDAFPLVRMFLHSTLVTSLSAYLNSVVMDKYAIVMPLLASTIFVATCKPNLPSRDWEWGVLITNAGLFSLWPLLRQGNLGLQYVLLLILWNYSIGYNPFELEYCPVKWFSLISYAIMGSLHWLEVVAVPKNDQARIFDTLNMIISSVILFCCNLWAVQRQIDEWWAAGGLGLGKKQKSNNNNNKHSKLTTAPTPRRNKSPLNHTHNNDPQTSSNTTATALKNQGARPRRISKMSEGTKFRKFTPSPQATLPSVTTAATSHAYSANLPMGPYTSSYVPEQQQSSHIIKPASLGSNDPVIVKPTPRRPKRDPSPLTK